MTNNIDFTETIKTLKLRFKHFEILSQTDRTLRGIVSDTTDGDTYPSKNLFTIHITCDTGYPGVHDTIGYSADISMIINGTERIINSVGYTTFITEFINYIKNYCNDISTMVLDVSSDNNNLFR